MLYVNKMRIPLLVHTAGTKAISVLVVPAYTTVGGSNLGAGLLPKWNYADPGTLSLSLSLERATVLVPHSGSIRSQIDERHAIRSQFQFLRPFSVDNLLYARLRSTVLHLIHANVSHSDHI